MRKKGSWFSSIKKTLSPSSKEKKIEKSEHNAVVEDHPSVSDTPIVENAGDSYDSHPLPPPEEVTPLDEPPQAASVATADVLTPVAAVTTRYAGELREEVAAIKIQTVFRGYMARRALWGLRGFVRLKTVVEGPCVKLQTVNTLKSIQTLSHLQSQISSRRSRMAEENQAIRKQLLRAKETANMENGDEWDDRVQSKEEIEAKLLSKYDATMRRERALAYSFSHQQQWKKSAGTAGTNMLFMNPTNPQWGWSWSERYKDHGTDHVSVKSGTDNGKSEITKSYARRQLNSVPSTPRSKGGGGGDPLASRKPKTGPSPRANGSGVEVDDDSKSVSSVKSEINRRHSVGGSVVAGKSAKGKPRGQGVAGSGGGSTAVVGGAKKHLSFQAKPRRHSGPPKVEPTVCDGLEQSREVVE
ncbi:protein IQ-DOMAIN 2-like [Bidens hawaiensis]|uniref:protein IQ-DOMAIN 2-like n=1 Tax=Bidens hawaiensis TaxID=980011 RepID=UPI00404B36C0